jgi:hypothetical protein
MRCPSQDRDAVQAPASTGAPSQAAGPAGARPGGTSPQAPGDGGGGGRFLDDLLHSSYERQAPGVGEMRHGTEGWRGLETSFWVRGAWRTCVCARGRAGQRLSQWLGWDTEVWRG